MAGPGVVSQTIAQIIPNKAEMAPIEPEITNIHGNRFVSKYAVDAGIINIATTKITPTDCKDDTTAKLSNNIKK